MDRIMGKNASSGCSSYYIPTIQQYLSATNIYGITLVSVGTTALIVVLGMFLDTLRYIMCNSSSRVKAHSAFVIGVYPVISLVTYLAILVPRAHLLAEAITQGMFMAGMYQLFCLFISYCGGEAELVRIMKPSTLDMRVAPCCCWPCCGFLPSRITVNKRTINILRVLVLQLPLVQGSVYLILLVMWAERESLYEINYMYVQPVIVSSILFGIWSMSMVMKALRTRLCPSYLLIGKFMALQMVLVFAKVQGIGTRALVYFEVMPCRPPITAQVYANLLHNTLMLAEMVVLGATARRLYKRPLPHSSTDIAAISSIGKILAESMNNQNNNNGDISNDRSEYGIDNKAVDITL